MNTAALRTTHTAADPLIRQLPDLHRLAIPKWLDGEPGFEIVTRYREIAKEASNARAALIQAEQAIHDAATEVANANADAMIAGDAAPKTTAVEKAKANAEKVYADAHVATLAANKMRAQVIAATVGDAAEKFTASDATRKEAARIKCVNMLEGVADALADMQAVEVRSRWFAEVKDRKPLDRALRPMPSPRPDLPLSTPNGENPVQLLNGLLAFAHAAGADEDGQVAA